MQISAELKVSADFVCCWRTLSQQQAPCSAVLQIVRLAQRIEEVTLQGYKEADVPIYKHIYTRDHCETQHLTTRRD